MVPTLRKVLPVMDIHPFAAPASPAGLVSVRALAFIANQDSVFDVSGDGPLQGPTQAEGRRLIS